MQIEAAQANLGPKFAEYEGQHACLDEADDAEAFLVDRGHWRSVGETLEIDAVERAHAEQIRQGGREEGRSAEFETALEIPETAVIG